MTQPVDWTASGAAEGWERRLVLGGGALRAVDPLTLLEEPVRTGLRGRLEQVLLAVHDPKPTASGDATPAARVAAAGRRILQRGERPPPDPGIERELLVRSGLADLLPSALPGDLAMRPGPRTVPPAPDQLLAAAVWSAGELTPGIVCQGPQERFFKWARARCGDQAARWLAVRDVAPAEFLFAPPWREPALIELDPGHAAGSGHAAGLAVDGGAERAALAAPGLPVERVPTSEVMALQGPALDRLVRLLTPPSTVQADRQALTLVYGPLLATWLGLAILEVVERCWLRPGGTWKIRIVDPLGLGELLLRPVLELLAAVDGLFGTGLSPARCEVCRGRAKPLVLEKSAPATYSEVRPGATFRRPDVEILLEPERGPIDALPEGGRHPLVVARCSALPGVPPAFVTAAVEPPELARDPALAEPCLNRLLTAVFAKQAFRQGQLAALTRVLRGQDCVLHLPPGAGKSIVYQMAGLVMPGTTVVVEPGAELIDDQLRGLLRNGIRRVRVLDPRPPAADEPLFCFVDAGRLRQESPRRVLADLAAGSRLALVVVDEAHSVSEWSHDFRLSYEAARQLLERLAAGGSQSRPPVLALTGTASRRVGRDILVVLAGGSDPDALVRAASMRRPELDFELLSATPERAQAALDDHLHHLPRRFELPEARFFGRGGEDCSQGIVFCPAADGGRSAAEVWRRLGRRLGPEVVGVWAPAAPEGMPQEEFERQRSRSLRRFRRGELPLLVADPGLGIGTSVPSVRYVVHLGFPGPLEAYAQQAGRAGHDGRPAICTILYVGRSSPEVERLLDPARDGEAVRQRLGSLGGVLEAEEDLARQLDRHFAAFPGREAEMAAVVALLADLDWTGEGGRVELPASVGDASLELALYRLSLLGIVRAWSRRGGEETFTVRTESASSHDLDAALLRFVERTRPSRQLDYQERLARLPEPTPRTRAETLAEMVLDLVYEAIEPARRSSLRDMWRLVRVATGSRELAQEVDAGVMVEKLAPRIDDLLASGEAGLSSWLELLVELTVQDAGELEAAVERSFAGHPGHPGLLLAAAAARLFRHQSRAVFFADIEGFMTAARQGGVVDWPELRQAAVWLARRAREISSPWAVGPWLAWEEADGPPHLLRIEEIESLRDERQQAAESVVVLARRLAEAGAIARSLAQHFQIETGDL